MTRISCEEPSVFTTNGNHDERSSGETRIRWSRDFLNGGYARGETLELREFANDYGLDFDSAPTAFADLDTLGMVTRTHSNSAFVGSPYPKDMQVAGEIREAPKKLETAKLLRDSKEIQRNWSGNWMPRRLR